MPIRGCCPYRPLRSRCFRLRKTSPLPLPPPPLLPLDSPLLPFLLSHVATGVILVAIAPALPGRPSRVRSSDTTRRRCVDLSPPQHPTCCLRLTREQRHDGIGIWRPCCGDDNDAVLVAAAAAAAGKGGLGDDPLISLNHHRYTPGAGAAPCSAPRIGRVNLQD